MFNETLFSSSFDELRSLLLHDLTIFHVAIVYVLTYVIYKALCRYIYFKPQEHASKVNRTFLTISILIVLLNIFHNFTSYLPFLLEYRWLYSLCALVILIAPLSIIMDRVIWKYDRHGGKNRRDWHYDYLPISRDYYKTTISKSEKNGMAIHQWEEEGVESTKKNIHSDVLLNVIALVIFLWVSMAWAHNSAVSYGYITYIFSIIICLPIASIFFDSAIFSWIYYLERNTKKWFKR